MKEALYALKWPFEALWGQRRDCWSFSSIFDDTFNFHEFPKLQTLTPFNLQQLLAVVSHQGLNVYEPVGNILKALEIDFFGLDGYALRMVSLSTHILNSCLLVVWLLLLSTEERHRRGISFTNAMLTATLLSALWAVHPLNVEVIGWLSAQNYVFALFFALLSSIFLELAIPVVSHSGSRTRSRDGGSLRSDPSDNSNRSRWQGLLSIFFYVCSCWCKAPAILLAAAQMARLLGDWGRRRHDSNFCNFVLGHSFYLVLGFAICIQTSFWANNESNTNYPEYTSLLGLLVGSALRAALTIHSALGRTLFPVNLSIHYALPLKLGGLYLLPQTVNSGGVDVPTAALCGMQSDDGIILNALCAACVLWVVSAYAIYAFACRGHFVLLLGWVSYLLLWMPSSGMIQHGTGHLGLDRYSYFPLAFGLTPFAWSLACDVLSKCIEHVHRQSGVAKSIRLKVALPLLGLVTLVPCMALLGYAGNATLDLWRDDSLLLANCLKVDSESQYCHYWAAELHSFHSDETKQSDFHREKVVSWSLREPTPPQLLYSAHVLFQMRDADGSVRKREACELVRRAAESGAPRGGPVRQARNVHAMVVNDQLLCSQLDGMTATSVAQIIENLEVLLDDEEGLLLTRVRDRIEHNVRSMQSWLLDRSPFEAKFLW